jgi:hypothetical protein
MSPSFKRYLSALPLVTLAVFGAATSCGGSSGGNHDDDSRAGAAGDGGGSDPNGGESGAGTGGTRGGSTTSGGTGGEADAGGETGGSAGDGGSANGGGNAGRGGMDGGTGGGEDAGAPGAGGAPDENECANGTDECDGRATCTDRRGGYDCTCPAGMQGDGFSCTHYASCASLLAGEPGLASGVFVLDADGGGPGLPFSAYCDMQTDGGGWTRIARLAAGSRTIDSIHRSATFFTQAWAQGTNGYTLGTNAQVTLDGATYGMLDATELFASTNELRFSCDDMTRGFRADAIWALDVTALGAFRTSMSYSASPFAVRFSRSGADYVTQNVYPTNTPTAYFGANHICGSDPHTDQGFQIGLCATAPTVPDTGLSDLAQIAFGYHHGFAGLRLECTADTPETVTLFEGTWQAWVR